MYRSLTEPARLYQKQTLVSTRKRPADTFDDEKRSKSKPVQNHGGSTACKNKGRYQVVLRFWIS